MEILEAPKDPIMVKDFYPFIVWAITLASSGLLFCVFAFGDSGDIVENGRAFLAILWISFLVSLPTLLIYLLAFYLLKNRVKSFALLKSILIAISVAGICITFKSLEPTADDLRGIRIMYCCAAIFWGLVIKLGKKQELKESA